MKPKETLIIASW